MKVREVIRILEHAGFRLVRQRGSHRHFRGVVNAQTRTVTVAGRDGDDISKGTLSSIKRQSGLPVDRFRQK